MNTAASVAGDRRWRQPIGGIIGDRVNTDEMDTSKRFWPHVFPSFRARQQQSLIITRFSLASKPASMSIVFGSNMEAATHLNSIWSAPITTAVALQCESYHGSWSSVRPLSNVWLIFHSGLGQRN